MTGSMRRNTERRCTARRSACAGDNCAAVRERASTGERLPRAGDDVPRVQLEQLLHGRGGLPLPGKQRVGPGGTALGRGGLRV